MTALVVALLLAQPLRLHPQNPRYLELDGKPAVLITATEHYGAVLNLDFDFGPYLAELARDGLNLARIFTGAYVENQGAFGIKHNNLAPGRRLITPWARSKGKFDLTRWDPAYFRRLDAFVTEAGKRGVAVELTMFSPFYEDAQWALSPLNASNNVNGIGKMPRTAVYTGQDAAMQAIQEAMVRKLVTELNRHDNLYYEICNEPYFGGVTLDWQRRIAEVIVQTEKTLPKKHLIAQNIANGTAKAPPEMHPAVSILNFHYATPPAAVADNWALKRPIADDETGFRGTADEPYRLEAWDFLLAGGAIFDHLDYSFTTRDERGRGKVQPGQPGGGGVELRRQLRHLSDFMRALDFVTMQPAPVVRGGVPGDLSARGLAKPGEAYAVYLRPKPVKTTDYVVRWTGSVVPRADGPLTFHLVADDGARLWIDALPLIDAWSDGPTTERSGTVKATAGRPLRIKVEYNQGSGGAVARLLWSAKGLPRQVVPASQLLGPDGKRGGLEGRYFVDRDFRAWGLTRRDAVIDFDWSVRSPFASAQSGQERRVVLQIELPQAQWRADWLDPISGTVTGETFSHAGGPRSVASPPFAVDVALRIRRVN